MLLDPSTVSLRISELIPPLSFFNIEPLRRITLSPSVMHGMNFTFGIRNYFSFTFSLQLGSPPLVNEEESNYRASGTHFALTV